MIYELYLAHHGIKGQRWGVRNGPPYPLRTVSSKTSANELNEIYNTLSEDDKRKLQGINKESKENAPKTFTDEIQLASEDHIRSFIAKYKNVPISAFGTWNEGDGNVALSIMTRGEKQYRNKGFATLAVKKGMEWIDNNPEIMNAYWDVRVDNEASIALAKKFGFKKMKGESPDPQWTAYRKQYKR